jgi:hypothetical protein
MTPTRFLPAVLVDFSGERLGDVAELAGPKKKMTPKQRQIRRKLRRARALKKRIAHLRIRKPLGWKGAVRSAKTNLRVVMSDLKMLGWKPKTPSRPRKPGEDEMDAALEDIPEAEPGESDDEELEELPDSPEAEPSAEGNWLDGYVGVEPKAAKPKTNLLDAAARLVRGAWRPFDHLGENARIQTRTGHSAMVTTVKPGLFIVQLVSDGAAKKIAGDNVGVLPLLLYPLVKQKIQERLAPKAAPAPAAAPAAQSAPAPAAAGLGCDACKDGR